MICVCQAIAFASGCGNHGTDRAKSQRAVVWRGMRVNAGPRFSLDVRDSVLFARKGDSRNSPGYELLAFRWMESNDPSQFESKKRECLGQLHCRVEADTAQGTAYDCLGIQNGRLSDSSFSSAIFCRVHGRPIEARYFCHNDDCDRIKDIVADAFGSLNPRESAP